MLTDTCIIQYIGLLLYARDGGEIGCSYYVQVDIIYDNMQVWYFGASFNLIKVNMFEICNFKNKSVKQL